MTMVEAIRLHGASAVYQAAYRHMGGNTARGLSTVGLSARTMADVNAILSAAYAKMGDSARAIDYADSTAALSKIANEGKR